MSHFVLSEVNHGMGVEITGAQLNQPLENRDQEKMRQLFAKYGLLIFRGEELSMPDQMRVLSYLAPVIDQLKEVDPYITNQAGVWDGHIQYNELEFHSDFAFFEEPPTILSLFAVETDDDATGTKFASGKRAYSSLPESLKLRITDLRTRHALRSPQTLPQEGTVHSDIFSGVYHDRPLVLQDPFSGDPLIYLSWMMFDRILDLSESESKALVQEICALLFSDDNIYIHRWKTGDLVIWNNLSFQHARDSLRDSGVRTLRKVQCADAPIVTRFPDAIREYLMGSRTATPSV
jgi:taurine dioxygenase